MKTLGIWRFAEPKRPLHEAELGAPASLPANFRPLTATRRQGCRRSQFRFMGRDGVRRFRNSRRELLREILTRTFLMLIWLSAAGRADAEDQTKPTIRGMIGGLFFDEHSYMAESAVHLPILR